MSGATPHTPAGWYPDAAGVVRWWDGVQWTEHTQAATAQPAGAPAVGARGPKKYPGVPAGTPVYTPWTWWIVVLPFLSAAPLIGYFIDLPGRVIDFVAWTMRVSGPDGELDPAFTGEMISRQMALIFSPWYLAVIIVAVVSTAVLIWFAYLDHRDLQRLGYVRPFHWAWSFLGLAGYGMVYIIGRSIVVRSRSGRGMAPLWTTIALYGALLIVTFGWAAWFMVTIMDQLFAMMGSVPS